MSKQDGVIEFFHENGLDEILSDGAMNRYEESKKVKKLAPIKVDEIRQNNSIASEPLAAVNDNLQKKNSFIKPVFSTSGAISNLAKKFNQDSAMAKDNDAAFKALNDIVKEAQDLAASAKTAEELKKIVEDFDGCNLKKMATNTVFCDGNSSADIMVIGEAPGNHEDLQGIPFCGDSGKVLDAMFAGINMTRAQNYYISNVIFWRPPGNRRPTQEELAICKPFVERHIQLIAPKVIVLVGATAMSAILANDQPISKVRGQFLDFSPSFLDKTIKTFAIFHPSYLMRQPMKKKVAWQDMLALENFMQS